MPFKELPRDSVLIERLNELYLGSSRHIADGKVELHYAGLPANPKVLGTHLKVSFDSNKARNTEYFFPSLDRLIQVVYNVANLLKVVSQGPGRALCHTNSPFAEAAAFYAAFAVVFGVS